MCNEKSSPQKQIIKKFLETVSEKTNEFKAPKDIQFKERLSKNVENQQGGQEEGRSMGCKKLLKAFQTATSVHENDRNWFGSSPDQLGKKGFETTAIISTLSELRTERHGILKVQGQT